MFFAPLPFPVHSQEAASSLTVADFMLPTTSHRMVGCFCGYSLPREAIWNSELEGVFPGLRSSQKEVSPLPSVSAWIFLVMGDSSFLTVDDLTVGLNSTLSKRSGGLGSPQQWCPRSIPGRPYPPCRIQDRSQGFWGMLCCLQTFSQGWCISSDPVNFIMLPETKHIVTEAPTGQRSKCTYHS